MQPKTIKSKNNGCGSAPGNLVYIYNMFTSVCHENKLWPYFGVYIHKLQEKKVFIC